MIRILFFVLLFFGVVALSPLLIDEKGYILIAMGDYTIESTVLSASIMLAAVFIILILALKIFRGSLSISFGAWNKIAFASRRKGIANFNKGLAAYILTDYKQAEELFAKSAVPAKREQSAYLLAASAASKQKLTSNTNYYLEKLDKAQSKLKTVGLESVIVRVKLLISQKSYAEARTLLDEYHKHLGHDARLLSLEIDLCLIEDRFERAVEHLNLARKEKSFSVDKVSQWESKAFTGLFNNKITQQDKDTLTQYWQKLARKIRQRDAVLFAYCQTLAKHNITDLLTDLILPHLKKKPSAEFLQQLRLLPIKNAEVLIAQVQRQLQKDGSSVKWLSCLGHLALNSDQWSLAERSFRSLIKLEGKQYSKEDLQAFATALIKQDQHQAANEVYQEILTFKSPE